MRQTASAFIIMLFAIDCTANAADNSPDPAFGDNGTVIIEPGPNEELNAQFNVALLHDSFVHVINEIERDGKFISRVTRFDKYGSIDLTFGTGGHAELNGLDGFYDEYTWRNGLFDGDGTLYLVGDAKIGQNYDMLVCRLASTGAFDLGWGGIGTGCTTVAFDLVPLGADRGFTLALQANGRLVVAGSARSDGGFVHAAVARLNAVGVIDASFNAGTGKTTAELPNFWLSFSPAAIALDSQQRIVVAGTAQDPDPNFNLNACDEDYAVTRLLPDGSTDLAFGVRTVSWDMGPIIDDCAQTKDSVVSGGLSVYPNDAMLLVGDAQFAEFGRAIAAVKLTKDGELDPTFSGDGKLVRYVCDVCNYSYVTSSKVQEDGKIVVAGAVSTEGAYYDVFVARMLPDGSADGAFDGGGAVYFDYSFDGKETDDSPGIIDVDLGRIVVPGAAATLEVNPEVRLFVTALGETAGEPEIPIFSDGFEE